MTSAQESVLHRMVDALEAVDRAGLETVLASNVQLRASLPSRDVERSGRTEVAEQMLGWYRDATEITRVSGLVDSVGDVWHAGSPACAATYCPGWDAPRRACRPSGTRSAGRCGSSCPRPPPRSTS